MAGQNKANYEPIQLNGFMCLDSHEAFEMLLPYFENNINYFCNKYFAWGEDKDDLYQQGLMGLYNAILAYKPEKNGSFKALALKCIRLNVLNLVCENNYKKRLIHHHSSSLQQKISDDGNQILMDLAHGNSAEPLDILLEKESVNELNKLVHVILTDLERKVLNEFLDGLSYKQIGLKLSMPVKTVDNALQRIRRKLTEIII